MLKFMFVAVIFMPKCKTEFTTLSSYGHQSIIYNVAEQ